MESDKHPWERQTDESAQAYAAFVVYRDMRPDRSIDHVYRALRGQQNGNKRATGQFTDWSRRFAWKERAEAYDAYLELKVRVEAENAAVDEHRNGLAAFLERQRRLSAAATDAAIALMAKATERLSVLEAAEITAGMLPGFFRAAAAIAESASNSEAQSLAVEQLLQALERTPA